LARLYIDVADDELVPKSFLSPGKGGFPNLSDYFRTIFKWCSSTKGSLAALNINSSFYLFFNLAIGTSISLPLIPDVYIFIYYDLTVDTESKLDGGIYSPHA